MRFGTLNINARATVLIVSNDKLGTLANRIANKF
jgi:hypothetical protein